MCDPCVVGMGSRVRIRACGAEHDVTVVKSSDEEGLYRLSQRTPLGRALLGRRMGDEVQVETDAGAATYIIVSVEEAGS